MMVYMLMQWTPGQFRVMDIFRSPQEAMVSTGHTEAFWERRKSTHGHEEWACHLPSPMYQIYLVQEWAVR